MSGKRRVLVVDDSAFSRQSLRDMLESGGDIDVVGTAMNGVEAIEKTMRLRPDVITLDLEMPGMDGFSFLRWLARERPIPVIVVSSHGNTQNIFRALELGAFDFISKPSAEAQGESSIMCPELLEKVRGIRDLKGDRLRVQRILSKLYTEKNEMQMGLAGLAVHDGDLRVVAIGTSTGGPPAVHKILARIPPDFPAAILISQHMPKGFTASFAESLNRVVQIEVREARMGDIVERGKTLICPGGSHMALRKGNRSVGIVLKHPQSDDRYTPSADVMMSSVAEHFGPMSIGVVLTGMGNDGKRGIVDIKEKGGYTIAESESTAVVFGMPHEAIKTGKVDRVLPLYEIPKEIMRVVTGKKQGVWKKSSH
jgi:two-component system chemotaxis response regulator CheB